MKLYRVKHAVVFLCFFAAARSGCGWGLGHKIITREAYNVLPPEMQKTWAESRDKLIMEYCQIPDTGKHPEFVYRETRRPSVDHPWVFHYMSETTAHNLAFSKRAAVWYFNKTAELVKEGRYDDAAKAAGAIGHTIQDQSSAHCWDGYPDVSPRRVELEKKYANITEDDKPNAWLNFWALETRSSPPVLEKYSLKGYAPALLGPTIEDAAEEFTRRFEYGVREKSRQIYEEQLAPLRAEKDWRNDTVLTDREVRLVYELFDIAGKLTADTFYTALYFAGIGGKDTVPQAKVKKADTAGEKTPADIEVSEGLIFYVPFDGGVNAVYAGGRKEPVKSFDHELQFYEGVTGKSVLSGVGKPGMVYSTEGNILEESGTVAFWTALTGGVPVEGVFRNFFKVTLGGPATYLLIYQHFKYGLQGLVVLPEDATKSYVLPKAEINWQPKEFHHLCLAWDKARVRWYVDGMFIGERILPAPMKKFDSTFQLGGHVWSSPLKEKDDILFDDLRIYNRPLSPVEIKILASVKPEKQSSGKQIAAEVKIEPASIGIPYLKEISEVALRQSGSMATGFIDYGAKLPYGKYSLNQTKVWFAWNEKGLYLLHETGFSGEELKIVSERDDQYSAGEDAIEMFIHPDRSERKKYYQFNVTAGGFRYDAIGLDKSFNSGWTAKADVKNGKWIVQTFIPFADIGLLKPEQGKEIGLFLARDWADAPNYFTIWSMIPGGQGFHIPEGFASAYLVKNKPVVQVRSVGDLWKGEAVLDITVINMSPENRTINVRYGVYENSGAAIRGVSADFQVSAGGRYDKLLAIDKMADFISEGGYYIARYDIETEEGETLAGAVLPFLFDPHGKEETVKPIRKLTQAELEKARRTAEETWLKEKAGMDYTVPQPFTPGEVSGDTLKVCGRDYRFGNNGLLSQLKNQGHDMFVSPVNLVSVDRGKKTPWRWNWGEFESPYEDRHIIKGTGVGPGLRASIEVTIEFDGFARYDLTVMPEKEGATVSPLNLEIEIFAELATLQAGMGNWSRPGFVHDRMASPFIPVLWVGNEETGFSWSAEDQAGWLVNDYENAIVLSRDNKRTQILIRLIDRDTVIKDARKITFALQGTPMRPMRKNWRYYSHSPWPSEEIRKDGWIYFREERWWNHGFFMIKPYEVDNWFAKRIEKAEKSNPYENLRIVTYGTPLTSNISVYGEELPEWQLFGKEWMTKPSKYTMTSDIVVADGKINYDRGQAAYLCPRSSFVDYRTWELQEWLRLAGEKYPRVKGLYWDLSEIRPCENKLHGCGYEAREGICVASWPTFAMREYLKRLYKTGRRFDPDFFQIWHALQIGSPASGFADASLLGEQYRVLVEESYFDAITPEETRVMFIGRQFGWNPYFLPELGGGNDPRSKSEGPTEEMVAMFLPLDTQIYRIHCNGKVVNRYEKVRYEFGMGDDVKFIGYWKNRTAAKPDNEKIWVSAYIHPGRALLLVTNPLKNNVSVTFKIDRAILGFEPGAKLTARDALQEKEIEIKNDVFSMDIDGRRLRMIRLDVVR